MGGRPRRSSRSDAAHRRERPGAAVIRIGYNTSVYVLAAAARAGKALPFEDEGFLALTAAVLLAATAFYAVNLPLVAAIVARWAREPFFDLLQRAVRSTFVVFAIMASVSLMLAALWERSPFLAAALAGPLLAIALYQRSVHRELEAVRLALTDPLTGLGNHRSFQERLQHDLEAADAGGTILSLCLLGIDNFKDINDRHGHPVGDRVLAHIARRLRQNSEAFRLGGDEFALLLPGRGEDDAAAVAEAVLHRVAMGAGVRGVEVTLSAGIAEYPRYGVDRRLLRVADAALCQAKNEGKNHVRVYRPDVQELGQLRDLAEGRDQSARLRRPPPSRTRSTVATRTVGITRTWWASSRGASPSAWGSLVTRSSSLGWPAACTTSASSPSPRTSCASRDR